MDITLNCTYSSPKRETRELLASALEETFKTIDLMILSLIIAIYILLKDIINRKKSNRLDLSESSSRLAYFIFSKNIRFGQNYGSIFITVDVAPRNKITSHIKVSLLNPNES